MEDKSEEDIGGVSYVLEEERKILSLSHTRRTAGRYGQPDTLQKQANPRGQVHRLHRRNDCEGVPFDVRICNYISFL